MSTLSAAFVALLLGLILYYTVHRPRPTGWRPAELQDARLVMVEKDLFTRAPFAIAGRPDQVYRLPNGAHVPVDLKNRDHTRAYATDIAELSLQAWLLRRNGKRTAGYAYVALRNRTSGAMDAIRVNLWNDAQCETTIARYHDLMAGRVMPRRCEERKCSGCGHQRYC